MGNFQIAYNKTQVNEGGYANNPNDHGGETWRGIARKFTPKWSGWVIIDKFKNLPGFPGSLYANQQLQQLVLRFYTTDYWNVLNLDKLTDQQMCNEVFDTGVNMGSGTAAKMLQRVINVVGKAGLVVDGQLGIKSLSAYNKLIPHWRACRKLFNCLRGMRYITICENDPSQREFLDSWASRIVFE